MVYRARGWVATLTAGLAGLPLTAMLGFSPGMVVAVSLGCAVGLMTARSVQPQPFKSASW